MTPAELITQKLKARIEAAGATLPVYSLLLEALAGEKHETPSSGIAVNVHIADQLEEPLPHYAFSLRVVLSVALDDDKGGSVFKENYDAIWTAFDYLARADNCTELGDENDTVAEGESDENDTVAEGETHIFAADGFQLGEGDPPDYQEDENGGTWTTSFAATITGRAN